MTTSFDALLEATDLPLNAKLLGMLLAKGHEPHENGLYRNFGDDHLTPYEVQLDAWKEGRPIPPQDVIRYRHLSSHRYVQVYVLHDRVQNLSKIGFSTDPKSRVRQYRSAHPGLVLLATACGNAFTKQMLCVLFAHKNVEKDWFRLSLNDIRLIKRIFSPYPPTQAPTKGQ